MKTTKKILLATLFLSLIITSCSKDDPEPVINASNFTTTIDENPDENASLGTIVAAGTGTLNYAIASQTPNGALHINSTTGELTVADASLFDFETSPNIDAVITILNTDATTTVNATIHLNDIDDIASFLSSSKTAYTNANDNDWIEVTEAEYNNLAAKLNEVATAGLKEGVFEDDLSLLIGGAYSFTLSTQNTADTELRIKNDAYVFAFKYVSLTTDTRTADVVKTSSSSDGTLGYSDLGTALPSHSGEGTHYFVLKGNNTPNTADGYLAFYSSNATGHKIISGYTNFYIRGNNNDITGGLEDIIYQYQSLTTPQKQWD